MASTIQNGANVPLDHLAGSVPNVSGAMLDWFQPMTFTLVTKTIVASQLVETAEEISFRGVLQPLSGRQLMLKPEGERAWNWMQLHAEPVLTLKVDDVVNYDGHQYRVAAQKDYRLYGYVEYQLIKDWTGSGPA